MTALKKLLQRARANPRATFAILAVLALAAGLFALGRFVALESDARKSPEALKFEKAPELWLENQRTVSEFLKAADAGNLAVGTCIDVPSEGDFSTVTKHECTEPHDAEVVLVAELTGDTFPITLTLENYIGDNCVPAVESYTGRAAETIDDLELGYFSPTSDAWKDGERTITCYLYDVNNAKLTRSVKAGAGAPASS